MSQIDDGGEGINVDVNLVPFIDLMSVLIVFMLLTAVWTQISMIQLGSSIYSKRQDDEPLAKQEDKELRLDIKKNGYNLMFAGKSFPIPKTGETYDKEALRKLLLKIKDRNPDQTAAQIMVSEDLKFEIFIEGMDVLLQSQFPNIGVITGEVK
ncbi:MAG: biopolymer transporter ExbD [Pseudomonadota bacterium]|nr:biopolymer transporter ExbD [Pseudomonadota bacterium]